jgi:hypothetical protein
MLTTLRSLSGQVRVACLVGDADSLAAPLMTCLPLRPEVLADVRLAVFWTEPRLGPGLDRLPPAVVRSYVEPAPIGGPGPVWDPTVLFVSSSYDPREARAALLSLLVPDCPARFVWACPAGRGEPEGVADLLHLCQVNEVAFAAHYLRSPPPPRSDSTDAPQLVRTRRRLYFPGDPA